MLALRLGMTVQQLLSSMDSRELSEWWAFFIHQKRLEEDEDPESLAGKLKEAFGQLPREN